MVTQSEILLFLKKVIFGTKYFKTKKTTGIDNDVLFEAASNRAFRDFCRTIDYKEGYKQERRKARSVVALFLKESIKGYPSDFIIEFGLSEQQLFDIWHDTICDVIIDLFKQYTRQSLTYGQAQKWLNMTFKYLVILDVQEVSSLLPFLHIPIDRYVLKSALNMGVDKPDMAWSSWSDKDYRSYQLKLREIIKDKFGEDYPPLKWEISNWKNDETT